MDNIDKFIDQIGTRTKSKFIHDLQNHIEIFNLDRNTMQYGKISKINADYKVLYLFDNESNLVNYYIKNVELPSKGDLVFSNTCDLIIYDTHGSGLNLSDFYNIKINSSNKTNSIHSLNSLSNLDIVLCEFDGVLYDCVLVIEETSSYKKFYIVGDFAKDGSRPISSDFNYINYSGSWWITTIYNDTNTNEMDSDFNILGLHKKNTELKHFEITSYLNKTVLELNDSYFFMSLK